MFIILLTYNNGIEPVFLHLDAHCTFLDKYYQAGKFICSGAQNPRTGGVIICCADSKTQVEEIIQEDPFCIHDVDSYQIIEFEAKKYIPEIQNYI